MADSDVDAVRTELLWLAHELGRDARNLAILGEGNVSATLGDGRFLVKASGTSLGALTPEEVTVVHYDRILPALERTSISEKEIDQVLVSALDDPEHPKPSVETFLHALCLAEDGVQWVGHTHSVAINRILCSTLGAEPFRRHVFPDAVVVCGPRPAVVPYADPGFALAQAVRAELARYRESYSRAPKLLLMENHGPISLGASAREVLNVMLMANKWAEVLWGVLAVGEPRYLPDEDVAHLDRRLDEAYRRRELLRKPSST